jgi:WXXGXW repeat (2 copies)
MQIRFARTVLFAVVVLCISTASFAQVRVAITVGPPPIPVYDQPVCPGDGWLWTPGYWAYDYDISDYYWVPGTWVEAPEVGFLWTPGWWGWGGDAFIFHEGFWGPQVGFYGGINYGFGYFGYGFEGGRWDGGHFFYNRAVVNVNVNIVHNVYNTTVVHENINRVSYNGGHGGIDARPRPEDLAAERDRHIPPVAAQTQHMQQARGNPELRASVNRGRPPIAATARPTEFKGNGVVPAREAGAPYTPPNRGGEARANPAVHPRDLAPIEHSALPSTGNPKQDQKYQQQQEKMLAKQQQERDKLQQQQDRQHQQIEKQQANEEKQRQMEQQHQQQTQQLQERHQQQQQQFTQRVQQHASPPPKK